jgi:hypothetical protein
LISVSWADDPDCYDFPIKEICEFDFDKGETRLLLRSSTGEIVASERVVNGECTKELYSPLLEVISQNTVLRRKLKKAFESFWDKSLPFKEDELVFESFSLASENAPTPGKRILSALLITSASEVTTHSAPTISRDEAREKRFPTA